MVRSQDARHAILAQQLAGLMQIGGREVILVEINARVAVDLEIYKEKS